MQRTSPILQPCNTYITRHHTEAAAIIVQSHSAVSPEICKEDVKELDEGVLLLPTRGCQSTGYTYMMRRKDLAARYVHLI